MKRVIGHSLSFCVRDLVEGKAPCTPNQVQLIECGFEQPTRDIFISVTIRRYRDWYWRKSPDACAALAVKLFDEGRLVFNPKRHLGNLWTELVEHARQ